MIGTKKSFEVCAQWLIERTDTGWILCHGTVHGIGLLDGEIYAHCWLELPASDCALDLTSPTPVSMRVAKYRNITNAKVVATYGLNDAVKAIQHSKSCGPWHPNLVNVPQRTIH